MTQNTKLLQWLQTHNGITTLEAMQHLKILRVSERIRELEAKGYSFSHDIEHTENARVVRYRLIAKPVLTHEDRMAAEQLMNKRRSDFVDNLAVPATRYKEWIR